MLIYVAKYDVQSCWDFLVLEGKPESTNQEVTTAMGTCYTDLADNVTVEEGRNFYSCGI